MDIDPAAPTGVNKAGKVRAIAALAAQNRLSRALITGAAPVAVSLTSYGKRLETVGHAIESIARGPLRPRRMILWVSDDGFDVAAYPMLARLEKRGLEILRSADFGPHKKSHPYVEAYAAAASISSPPTTTSCIRRGGWLGSSPPAGRTRGSSSATAPSGSSSRPAGPSRRMPSGPAPLSARAVPRCS